MTNNEIIYNTGCSAKGEVLLGGVWRLYAQEGFPLEMSYVICQQNGWNIDWAEAMIDASMTNDCPSLMKQIQDFLPETTATSLKLGFIGLMQSGIDMGEFLREKRANGTAFIVFLAAALVIKPQAHEPIQQITDETNDN